MALNDFGVDPARLKILILSTPKTGNTWLRLLLSHAYGLPQVELPPIWDPECVLDLPNGFVSHQHYFPEESLVRWLRDERVVVLSTIRHPADTFLSLFHYVKWHVDDTDPAQELLRRDGEVPGSNSLEHIRRFFPLTYALSLSWAQLGSHIVRYEDLLADPVAELRRVTQRISPVAQERVQAAAFLCRPEYLISAGRVDERHLRTRGSRRWMHELPTDIIDALRTAQPFASACDEYAYGWEIGAGTEPPFDYDSIDPFGGRHHFDNGQPIGPYLTSIYLCDVPGARERFPDPRLTAGDSYWNWLQSPAPTEHLDDGMPPGTFTNLMALVYQTRPDLQEAYKDVAGSDRIGFLTWFIGFGASELRLPWGIVGAAIDAHCEYLRRLSQARPRQPRARITAVRVLDGDGVPSDSFRCGEAIQVEIDIAALDDIEHAVIGYTLRRPDGAIIFATNTRQLGMELDGIAAGQHRCTIRSALMVPSQNCYISVGLGRFDAEGAPVAVHRLFDHRLISVAGESSFGSAWCPTSFSLRDMEPAEQPAGG